MDRTTCLECGKAIRRRGRPGREKRRGRPKLFCGRDCALTSWKKNNPEKAQKIQERYRIRLREGVTEGKYQALYEAQKGRCAACGGKALSRTWMRADRSLSGIRGLVCRDCYTIIVKAGDDPGLLRAIADHIEREDVEV